MSGRTYYKRKVRYILWHQKYAGTKTEKNLQDAFAGESQARNKYTYYASVAKKAGYEQMASLYLETADQEKEHAKMWFKELHGGKVSSDIEENLKMQPQARTMSGPICMPVWPVKPGKKALKSWL